MLYSMFPAYKTAQTQTGSWKTFYFLNIFFINNFVTDYRTSLIIFFFFFIFYFLIYIFFGCIQILQFMQSNQSGLVHHILFTIYNFLHDYKSTFKLKLRVRVQNQMMNGPARCTCQSGQGESIRIRRHRKPSLIVRVTIDRIWLLQSLIVFTFYKLFQTLQFSLPKHITPGSHSGRNAGSPRGSENRWWLQILYSLHPMLRIKEDSHPLSA